MDGSCPRMTYFSYKKPLFSTFEDFHDKMSPMKMNSSSFPQGTPHNYLVPSEISLIRDYWSALENQDDHTKVVVSELFVYVVNMYPHLRPLWPFGRKKYEKLEEIRDNPGFVNHVNNVVTALNLCVTYLSNPKWLTHILQDVGCRHFFYDAMEPHFEVIGEALIAALKAKPIKAARFTPQTENAFIKMFKMVQESMSKGLAISRLEYLKSAVTKQEMVTIAQYWEKVRSHGTREAGLSLCSAALHSYAELIVDYGQEDFSISTTEESTVFKKFASDTMTALDATITSYNPDNGFLDLPSQLSAYTSNYYVTDVSPTVVRKALMEGMINMLTYVLGEVSMTESVQRTWLKVYRVMEQAIIINILQL